MIAGKYFCSIQFVLYVLYENTVCDYVSVLYFPNDNVRHDSSDKNLFGALFSSLTNSVHEHRIHEYYTYTCTKNSQVLFSIRISLLSKSSSYPSNYSNMI